MVSSLTVTFTDHEILSAGAFSVKTATGATVGTRIITRDVNGQTVVMIQFTDSSLVGGSLADGRYTQKADAGAGTNREMWTTITLKRTAEGWRFAERRVRLEGALDLV